MDFAFKHKKSCIENEELCIKHEELCVKNDELCRLPGWMNSLANTARAKMKKKPFLLSRFSWALSGSFCSAMY